MKTTLTLAALAISTAVLSACASHDRQYADPQSSYRYPDQYSYGYRPIPSESYPQGQQTPAPVQPDIYGPQLPQSGGSTPNYSYTPGQAPYTPPQYEDSSRYGGTYSTPSYNDGYSGSYGSSPGYYDGYGGSSGYSTGGYYYNSPTYYSYPDPAWRSYYYNSPSYYYGGGYYGSHGHRYRDRDRYDYRPTRPPANVVHPPITSERPPGGRPPSSGSTNVTLPVLPQQNKVSPPIYSPPAGGNNVAPAPAPQRVQPRIGVPGTTQPPRQNPSSSVPSNNNYNNNNYNTTRAISPSPSQPVSAPQQTKVNNPAPVATPAPAPKPVFTPSPIVTTPAPQPIKINNPAPVATPAPTPKPVLTPAPIITPAPQPVQIPAANTPAPAPASVMQPKPIVTTPSAPAPAPVIHTPAPAAPRPMQIGVPGTTQPPRPAPAPAVIGTPSPAPKPVAAPAPQPAKDQKK